MTFSFPSFSQVKWQRLEATLTRMKEDFCVINFTKSDSLVVSDCHKFKRTELKARIKNFVSRERSQTSSEQSDQIGALILSLYKVGALCCKVGARLVTLLLSLVSGKEINVK